MGRNPKYLFLSHFLPEFDDMQSLWNAAGKVKMMQQKIASV